MYWDFLDWYLVLVFATQIMFLHTNYRLCSDRKFRKAIELILNHADSGLTDMQDAIRLVGIMEIAIFFALLLFRFIGIYNSACTKF